MMSPKNLRAYLQYLQITSSLCRIRQYYRLGLESMSYRTANAIFRLTENNNDLLGRSLMLSTINFRWHPAAITMLYVPACHSWPNDQSLRLSE